MALRPRRLAFSSHLYGPSSRDPRAFIPVSSQDRDPRATRFRAVETPQTLYDGGSVTNTSGRLRASVTGPKRNDARADLHP
jgi:hypothetical protein